MAHSQLQLLLYRGGCACRPAGHNVMVRLARAGCQFIAASWCICVGSMDTGPAEQDTAKLAARLDVEGDCGTLWSFSMFGVLCFAQLEQQLKQLVHRSCSKGLLERLLVRGTSPWLLQISLQSGPGRQT